MSACILKHLVQKLCVVISILVLAACETNLSTPDLRIVNEEALPTEMTWYSPIDIPIEIAGGEGGFNVRYIQNPEAGMSEELTEDAEGNNTISLSVVKQEGTQKNTFRLQGTPIPAVGDSPVALDSDYWLEVTDGSESFITRFPFTIGPVAIESFATSSSFDEGGANFSGVEGRNIRGKQVCTQLGSLPQNSIDKGFGLSYPNAVLLTLTEPVSIPLVFDYVISEDDSGNSPASPLSDFETSTGQVRFEPGDTACGFVLYLIDDLVIEPPETFKLDLLASQTIVSEFENRSVVVNIVDNEPRLKQESLSFIATPGDAKSFSIELSRPAENTLLVPFTVNEDNSTLSATDYSITPASQVVEIGEGEILGQVSVMIESTITSTEADPRFYIEFQGATVADSEPQVEVEFIVNSFINTEAVYSSEPVDFVVIGADQNVYLGGGDRTNSSSVRLYSLNKKGEARSVNFNDFYGISSLNGVLALKELVTLDTSNQTETLALVMEVEGRFDAVSDAWGGQDFVLMVLEVEEDGRVNLVHQSQHGSESDDLITNIDVTEQNELIVSGYTQGRSLDGSSIIPSQGQNEGFVYKFDANFDIDYARFIGDSFDNETIAVLADGSSVNSFFTSDSGIFSKTLDDDGFVDIDIETVELPQPSSFSVGGTLKYEEGFFGALVTSSFDNDQTATPSLSNDVFFYDFVIGESSEVRKLFSVATSQDDLGVDSVYFGKEDSERIGAIGETLGVFGDQSSQGGRDVFFASINAQGRPELIKVNQFGTPGDDYAIDVIADSEDKFLVLWKEDHSSGDGTFRYRITPFSPDGENLLPIN
ncbi:hypothetical protein A3762_11645 [Oleiphilus sp. HI0125]|nr:hypothetical protein [Oleiphilus sp. HI0125]KZZ56077.1 hypothetical protein A3762_11645 [Oleiphilus sp. HI0125]